MSAEKNFVNQVCKIKRRLAVWGVGDNAFTVRRRFGNKHALADFGFKHLGAQLLGDLLGQLKNIAVQIQAAVELVEQDADHLQ